MIVNILGKSDKIIIIEINNSFTRKKAAPNYISKVKLIEYIYEELE